MISIDLAHRLVIVEEGSRRLTHDLASPEAFAAISRVWIRCGWELKYSYSFSWLGRPVIQLPQDLIRAQEAVYTVRPDVIVETGVAHGGGLVFYASLCKLNGRGRVIGVEVALRPETRKALAAHELAAYITVVDGDSTDPAVVERVRNLIGAGERVMVVLDSDHTRRHVRAELEVYGRLVSVGSYLLVTDGLMKDLAGAPRARPDWAVNNPYAAAQEFLADHPEFRAEAPPRPFDESDGLPEDATYWPGGWLRRLR